MNFRHDINGLRAIAVLAVVIFHFNPQWLPGGFAGVDVFFVISGFLMTSIIFKDVEKDSFNLFKFYNARANRIVPVLAAMSAVLLVFGWFYLIPTDYRELGKQIEKSSLFISNILFSKAGGYFDTAEHTKWLLHTWSLSVEWQFYIFFPIIIIALKKYLSITRLKHVVLALFLTSFIYCIYATHENSQTAYFLLTSRAWEMLLGGLAFLYPWSLKQKSHQIITQCVGIILIIASYFLVSKDTLWPSYMALIPVFGAYLIIVSHYQNNLIITNPVFSYIGQWSYSIYVWHWPLVVLGFYFALENWWIYGIPLSILLGFLSYHWIEKINFPRYSSWKNIYKVKPFYLFLVVLASAYIIKKTDGADFHYSKEVLDIVNDIQNVDIYPCDDQIDYGCIIGNPEKTGLIMVGDSHAQTLLTSILEVVDVKKESVKNLAVAACPFVLNTHSRKEEDCHQTNINRFSIIQSDKYHGVPVLIAGRFSYYLEDHNISEKLEQSTPKPIIYLPNDPEASKDQLYAEFAKNLELTVCSVSQYHPVYIMQPVPEMPFNVPRTMARNHLTGNTYIPTLSYSNYLARSQKMRDIITGVAEKCKATVIDPAEILCESGECISTFHHRAIYSDGDHLNGYGNKLLTPLFKKTFHPLNQFE